MLWRWQGNHRRFLEIRSRSEAFEREARALQKDVALRGGFDELRPRTRSALLEWAPALFARAD